MCLQRCSWAEFQHVSEVYPRYLTRDQAAHLHQLALQCIHLYHVSACVAACQFNLRWLVLPKIHLFHHMALDVPSNFLNIRVFHCFSSEDYMGIQAASTCTASNMEERVLKRALQSVSTCINSAKKQQRPWPPVHDSCPVPSAWPCVL